MVPAVVEGLDFKVKERVEWKVLRINKCASSLHMFLLMIV